MTIIRVGTAEIHRVEELTLKTSISALTTDKAFLSANADWLYPYFADADGSSEMIFQSWILRVDGQVIVVDPCIGNGRSIPAFPLFDMLDTPFIERFQATGIRPEDVDLVFCTHLHSDHCGWNTQLRGGRYVPTFPNARYVIVRREFDRWDTRRPDHHAVAANAGVFENSVLPILEAGLADIVDDRHRLSSSLSIEPAYGHTLGHSVLHLAAVTDSAVFTGDAFHHPLELVRPELDRGSCENFEVALVTRRRIIAHCLEHNTLIVPAHFSAPYVGRLRRKGDGVTFVPEHFSEGALHPA